MSRPSSWSSRRRSLFRWLANPVIAGSGVALWSALLAVQHQPDDDAGVSAEDLAAMDLGTDPAEFAPEWTTGKFLIDFVEPEDGEGGSERAIASWVAELDALPGVEVEPAGFYSEGEHLYRLAADPAVWPSVQRSLLGQPLVEGVEPEVVYSIGLAPSGSDSEPEPLKPAPPRFEPNDPMFRYQWHMEQVRAPQAWASSHRGRGAIVAVIDTGVGWKSAPNVEALPDLADTRFVGGKSFVAGLPDGMDDHAHGSHVAGTIAQSTNNGIGVTGVAYDATIMPLKVLTAEGRGSVPGIANAIRYAADEGAHVVNMSLGGPLPSRILAKAIEYAHDKGVTVVCAAGNERRSRVGYPAAHEHSVAVSSTDFGRGLAFYSNWGNEIDVAAPGGDTRSDKNGDGKPDGVLQNTIAIQDPANNAYLWFQGTSMASPHAAGVAAIIVGEGVTNPDEVERILEQSAVHPNGTDWDKYFGAGIVDAAAAARQARGQYAPERLGFVLLGLLGLGAGALSRRRWGQTASILLAATLTAGAGVGTWFATPLVYAMGTSLGDTSSQWLASPWLLSSLVPVAITLLTLGARRARPWLAGLNLGYAAVLLHGAIVLPTLLSGVPGGPMIDRLWLLGHAIVAGWLAHRVARMSVTNTDT